MGTLTDAEKVAIRRHCGYPVFGNSPTQMFGYRFLQWYGTLEFRMNNLMPEEEAVVRDTFLANLLQLETDIVSVRTNLDTAAAAVWTRNADEHADREALYRSWRNKLCQFFGVPPGPGLCGGGMTREIIV